MFTTYVYRVPFTYLIKLILFFRVNDCEDIIWPKNLLAAKINWNSDLGIPNSSST